MKVELKKEEQIIDNRFFKRSGRTQESSGFKVNQEIRAKVVRVVGENIQNPGVVSLREALIMADELDLDLVEISPNADPPVCKVTDYQKFLYQQKKKQKEMKAKAIKVVVKEIRFGPHTDEHDYNFKLKHAQKFLEEGAKVKAFVFFKGRSIVYSKDGEILLGKLIADLEEYGKIDQEPKLEGKRMSVILSPKILKKKI